MITTPWSKLALAVGVGLGITAAVAGSGIAQDMHGAALTRETDAASRLDAARFHEARARFDLLAATNEHAEITAVSAERAGLVDAATAAGAALSAAADKIDLSAQRRAISDAANRALAERSDPTVVRSAADTIRATTKDVTNAVDAYEQAKLASEKTASTSSESEGESDTGTSGGASNSGGGGDWFAHARAVLDQVGGGGIELRVFNGNCDGTVAVACAYVPAYIDVSPGFADLSRGRQVWVMTHELAHFYQGYEWFQIQDSPRFQRVFGGDIERLANCMAQVRGAYSGCSGDELAFAAGIWDGVVS